MKGFYHRLHGGRFHDQVLMQIERYVVAHDWKLKSVDGFKDQYHCPCEPDAFFEIYSKKFGKQLYVVEVETNATKKSRETKWNQYKNSTAGITDLIIINTKLLKKQNNWIEIDKLIEAWMPGE